MHCPTALRWYVPPTAAPEANDTTNTFSYGYSSSVDMVGDENAGLVGGLVLGCKGCLVWTDPFHPKPQGIDALEPVLWQVCVCAFLCVSVCCKCTC